MPGVDHPLPMTAIPSASQIKSWATNNFPTCGREAFIGTVGNINGKTGMLDGGKQKIFQKKKIWLKIEMFLK